MIFAKATRTRAFIKMALTGPSGSGKTLSALKIARGLAGDGKIAVIDTENESASLYADATDFDTCPISAPFTIEKYSEAIQAAAKAGYSVLVIDSLTHAWAGEGGLLAQKESLDARGGNSFTNWASITKMHEKFKAEILQSPIHVIVTMRSKHEYVVDQSSGKVAPKKVGMSPIQRDGMEYEFTIVLDMGMNHEFAASKDRTGLFDGKYEKPTEGHGIMIRSWLESGNEPAPKPAKSNPLRDEFDRVARENGVTFLGAAERGVFINEALGRSPDCKDPLTPDDWKQAIANLPQVIAESRKQYGDNGVMPA